MSEQVLIVGAGPVGLTMATELRRYGVPVRIIEKTTQRTDQSRALFLWSRTLELLDRLGAGEALVAAGRKVEAVNILSGSKRIGRVDFADIESAHPYALMLPQAETERVLEENLAAHGVKVERGTELVTFTNGDNAVSATLRRADGTEETLTAPWLIGCDGGGSFVRKTLGLSSTGPAQQSDWLIADVHLAGFDFPPTELASFWHEDGFLAIFTLAPGRHRVIADLRHAQGVAPLEADLDLVQYILHKRGPGGVIASAPSWLSTFRIHERNVTNYRAGRVFLAGDAAHVHNPVGAQGMNMGIHDAVNLAWKLALVRQGVANAEALLESYNVERHAVAEHLVAEIGRASAISLIKIPSAQFARNLLGNIFFGLAPARRAVAETLSEVSLGYRDSPLNAEEDHALPGPGPGERLPPQPGQPPLGMGDSPRFALFGAPGPGVDALQVKYAGLLEPDLRPPVSPRCLWLVRPDGYVAAEVLEEDVHQLDDYLYRYIGGDATTAASL
ncbi:MAG: FAD-dependent monooxygenase [Acidocella sp.]|nr:FAD-dependent monooxygenase [Acidocella sp.]